MSLDLFSWVIPGKLAGSAAPGGIWDASWQDIEADVRELHGLGIRCLVSLHRMPPGLGDLCRRLGIEWFDHPVKDYSVPSNLTAFTELIDTLVDRVERGVPVCVHCRAGVGRTGMVLACVVARLFRISGDQAIRAVRRVRPALDTADQEAFVKGFCRLPSERLRAKQCSTATGETGTL